MGLLLCCLPGSFVSFFLESGESVGELVDLGLEEIKCFVVAFVLLLDHLVLFQSFPLDEWRVYGLFDPLPTLVGSDASVGRAVGQCIGLVEGCEVGVVGVGCLCASVVQTVDSL